LLSIAAVTIHRIPEICNQSVQIAMSGFDLLQPL
jgi:hypothetical protein